MKKLMLASMIGLTLTAGSAFAEDPVQVVTFNGVITKNIAGDESGITGVNGGAVVPGSIKVAEDGSFFTTTSVALEHHKRDDVNGTVTGEANGILPDLIPVTNWTVTQLQYFINGTPVASSNLTLKDNGTEIATTNSGAFTATNKMADDTSKLVLSVEGSAITDPNDLLSITPGINPVAVYATVTASIGSL